MKGANLPPLVTGSPPGTPLGEIGVPGAPGTAVLFGGSAVNSNLSPGGRVTAGLWLDDCQTIGVEGYFFQLAALTTRFSGGSPSNVGRPFINTATGQPDAELVSFPGFLDGSVQANAASGSLLGAGALARFNLCAGCCYCLNAVVGYRYLSLTDQVGISENLTSTDVTQSVAPLGTNIIVTDSFRTTNHFNGGDIGLAGGVSWNAWSLGASARIALGCTHERADIEGATSVTVPGFPTVFNQGGLLALSSNSGIHTRDVFAVVPEARLQLAYLVNWHLRLHVGYTFLYWSQVARAGDQIDLVVNPGLLPPPIPGSSPARPAFNFQGTGFWAQGVDLGLTFRF
jgi:hypothetical protein